MRKKGKRKGVEGKGGLGRGEQGAKLLFCSSQSFLMFASQGSWNLRSKAITVEEYDAGLKAKGKGGEKRRSLL